MFVQDTFINSLKKGTDRKMFDKWKEVKLTILELQQNSLLRNKLIITR